jgi:hypothetical protein
MREERDLDKRLEEWTAAKPLPEVPAALVGKIQRELRQSLTPVRPLPGLGARAAVFLAVALVAAGAAVALLGKDGLSMMTRWQAAGTAAVLGAGACCSAFTLAAGMAPGSRRRFSAAAVAGLTVAGLAGVFAAFFPWESQGGFVAEGWPCAALELAIAAPAALVFWMWARRGANFGEAGGFNAIAALSLLVALTPAQTHCMSLEAPHLLVWHLGTAVLAGGVGVLRGGWSAAAGWGE